MSSQLSEFIKSHPSKAISRLRDAVHEMLKSDDKAFPRLLSIFPEFADDEATVLLASKNCSEALKLASDRLRSDPDIVRTICTIASGQFKYASKELQEDKEFVCEILTKNRDVFQELKFMESPFTKDEDVVMLVMKRGLPAYQLTESNLDNENIIRLSLLRGQRFSYASTRLHNDRDMAQFAIEQDANNWNFISERLKNDPDLVKLAVEKDYRLFVEINKNHHEIPNFQELLSIYMEKCYEFPHDLIRQTLNNRIHEQTIVNALSKRTNNFLEDAYRHESGFQKAIKSNFGSNESDLCLEWLIKATNTDLLKSLINGKNQRIIVKDDISGSFVEEPLVENEFLQTVIKEEIERRKLAKIHQKSAKNKNVKAVKKIRKLLR